MSSTHSPWLSGLLNSSQDAFSEALLLKALRRLLGEEPGQAQEVVGGAAEDEDPVHLVQSAQLYLAELAGLFQPSEALLN